MKTTKPTPNLQAAIKRTPVKSSQIRSVGHDPKTNTLEIEFFPNQPKQHGDKQRTSVYRYAGVTKELAEKMLSADSVGSFFYKHIKPNTEAHPYIKIK